MNLNELKAKYPTFTIRSDPSPTCPVCKGVGEYLAKDGSLRICLCACIAGDDYWRNLAADVMHRKMWSKK